MPDPDPKYPNPREEDIMAGDRRLSRPDSALPDWEMPDAAYRPVPIVWFTGAFFLHVILIMIFAAILASASAMVTIGLAALAAGAIGKWTWERGMKDAGAGWKTATIIMFAVNLFFLAAATMAV